MLNSRSYVSSRGSVTALALMAVLFMVAAPAAATGGPWIDVQSPSDGDHLTSRTVTVTGTATEPVHTLSFKGEDLVHGEMVNIRWLNDNLTYRPALVFEDQFNGLLDTQKWTIVRDPVNVTVENGALKLNYLWAWPAPTSNGTMVKSTGFQVPEGVNFQATYKMKAGTYSYSGAGGGVSDGNTDVWDSHMATLGFWSGGIPASWLKVVAGGQAVYNATTYDIIYHDYKTTYDSRTGAYTAYRDDEDLGNYRMATTPSMFWFGHTDDTGMYDMRPIIEVDYVNVWATSGEWVSDVIDMGHHTVLEGSDLFWNSNHRRDARAILDVRSSMDEEDWTEWVTFDEDGNLDTPVNGTFYQLRLHLAIPDVLETSAHVTVTGIDLHYRNPIVTVEVKSQDTDWIPAEGLYEWQADMLLRENENTIEVRAIDTSGAINVTSFDLVVDTTVPVGTMTIAGDDTYTNDLNVTLLLNATDHYGVEWVDISHFLDFDKKLRLPYASSVEWRMSDVPGETYVYVRFIDSHGLVSSVSVDSIQYDPVPPAAELVIDEGAEFTGGHVVHLAMTYSDNVGVALVEIANDAAFTEPFQVPEGVTTINDWQLTEDGDGPRSVHMRVTDVAGNAVTDSDDIELYLPKVVGSVSIEKGAELTGHTVVQLTVEWPIVAGIRLMQVSNNPSFEGSEWLMPEEEVKWILPDGDGVKTVHVRFIDWRHIETLQVNDTIVLDQTEPVVNVTLDGGSPYTTVTIVTGNIVVDDASPPAKLWVSLDDSFPGVRPEDFVDTFSFNIPARESDHWVYVMVEDAAGNVGLGSGMIHYATIRPHITLTLPEGDVVQTSPTIPVEVTPVDPYGDIHLQYAFDQVPDEDGPWTPLNGPVLVDVPGGTLDGVHTIWVRARNAAGLTSETAVSIDLTLDTVAPMLSITRPEDGTKVTQKGMEVLLELMVSDSSKIFRLAYSVDGGAPQDLSTWAPTTNISFTEWGEHTIEVVAEDVAGNVATSTSVFRLEDAEAKSTGSGTGLLIIVLLAILGAAILVTYTYNRRFMPGLRSTSIHDGDGWHEEWDHPGIEECDDERRPCHLPVSTDDPAHLARVEAKNGKTPRVEDIEGTELEQVDLPEELVTAEPAGDDWSEF